MRDTLIKQARAVTHAACRPLVNELADALEQLRAEMDQRMKAYIEYQEEDEAEIERLRGGIKYIAEHPDTNSEVVGYCRSLLWKPRGARRKKDD